MKHRLLTSTASLALLLASACTKKDVPESCPPPAALGAVTNHTAGETSFLFFGDSGEVTPDQARVATAMGTFCAGEPCEFVALLGDNFYPSGVASPTDSQWETKFEQPYRAFSIPFFAALGNHDHGGSVLAQINHSARSPRWRMPSCAYTFKDDNAEFFVVDTEHFTADQKAWLDREITRSAADRSITWRIVYGHHPIYSYGHHGDTPNLKSDLLPLLNNRVDFYLSGHDHDRQVIDAERGVAFVISGASAISRPHKRGARTLFADSTFGFAHLRIKNRNAVLKMISDAGNLDFRRAYTK